jgi:hypothetical protein
MALTKAQARQLARYVDVVELPFTARPQRVTMYLGTYEFLIRLYWCKPAGCWVIDFSDVDNNLIAAGIPLVTGADLIEQFQYTPLRGGRMIVMSTDRPPETIPGWGDLGITGHVYWKQRPDERRRIWEEFSAYGSVVSPYGSDRSVAESLETDHRETGRQRWNVYPIQRGANRSGPR